MSCSVERHARDAPTLLGLLERSLANNASRTALVGLREGRSVTYAELDRASAQAAHDLRAVGVHPGDHVALLVENGLGFPVYDLAILRAGAVKVPLSAMLTADDIGSMLHQCRARAVVIGETLGALGNAALSRHKPPARPIAARSIEDLLGGGGQALAVSPDRAQDDGAAVFFTGGTSGRPKAVMHSQGGMAANMLSTVIEAEIGRDERLLLTTPLTHAAGLFTQAALIRGACAVIDVGFDAARTLATIESRGPSSFPQCSTASSTIRQ